MGGGGTPPDQPVGKSIHTSPHVIAQWVTRGGGGGERDTQQTSMLTLWQWTSSCHLNSFFGPTNADLGTKIWVPPTDDGLSGNSQTKDLAQP